MGSADLNFSRFFYGVSFSFLWFRTRWLQCMHSISAVPFLYIFRFSLISQTALFFFLSCWSSFVAMASFVHFLLFSLFQHVSCFTSFHLFSVFFFNLINPLTFLGILCSLSHFVENFTCHPFFFLSRFHWDDCCH